MDRNLTQIISDGNKESYTDLLLAAYHGHFDLFKYLFKEADDEKINEALRIAAEKGHIEIVRYVIEEYDYDYEYLIIFAAENGHFKLVKYLKEIEFRTGITDEILSISLFQAAENGHIEIVKYLYEHCDAQLIHGSADNSLINVIKNCHIQVLKYIVEKAPSVFCNKIFKYAAENGHIEIVKLLIEHKAYIHADDEFALRFAANNGHIEIVKLLIKHKADIHADNNGALRGAAHAEHFEIVELLISKGADIDNAIQYSKRNSTKNILQRYIKKEFYKGPINDQTETDCGICLTEMNTEQEIVQCKTCKKCVHNECKSKWETVNNSCVYCRN